MLRSVLAVCALALLGLASSCIFARAAFPDDIPAPAVSFPQDPAHIARGEYLTRHVAACLSCHATRDWSKYSGPAMAGTRGKGGEGYTESTTGFPGAVYTSNLTPAALGAHTDGEVLRAFTAGISTRGEPLFPLMPYRLYGTLAKDDMLAIGAYLRTLEPISNDIPERELNGPLPFIVRAMPQAAALADAPPAPGTTAYGEYLAQMAACTFCHSQDERGEYLEGLVLAGGKPFQLPTGGTVYSANISPDDKTGIGTWTKDVFIARFRVYTEDAVAQMAVKPGEFNTVMPWTDFAGMTDDDLGAIYDYLRAQPPVNNPVERFVERAAP